MVKVHNHDYDPGCSEWELLDGEKIGECLLGGSNASPEVKLKAWVDAGVWRCHLQAIAATEDAMEKSLGKMDFPTTGLTPDDVEYIKKHRKFAPPSPLITPEMLPEQTDIRGFMALFDMKGELNVFEEAEASGGSGEEGTVPEGGEGAGTGGSES